MKSLLPALLLLVPAVAVAQPPAKPPTLADLNKAAVDILRDMHDRGRELYNSGDAAGTLRVYQTALGTVKPFVAHHPAIQKAITDGLAEAANADGDKARAFKLHEVIEQVRADLRTETKKLEAGPKTPDPVVPPKPPAPKAALSGIVMRAGKPLAGAEVVVVSLNVPAPRVHVAKTAADGKYVFDTLASGEYVVIVTGAGVPAKYQTTDTSGLRAKVTAGGTAMNWELK